MDIVQELKKWGCKLEPAGGGKLLMQCPYPEHEDNTPSCQVQLEDNEDRDKGAFWCPVCNKGGDFYSLLGAISKTPAAVHKKQLKRKVRIVDPKKVEAWCSVMNVAGHITAASQRLKRELTIRGLSTEIMRKYSVGYDSDNKCITIPISWGGRYVNVLKYRPGTRVKFSNYALGYGNFPVLYPEDQLKYDKIILCGGPAKALVAAQHMNQHGFGAVSFLGERAIPLELVGWLYGKKVWVCFDVDKVGERASDQTCGVLRSKVDWVGKVELPLSVEVYPKGDLNDYFGEDEEYTDADFLKVLVDTKTWVDKTLTSSVDQPPKHVDISKLWGAKQAFNFSTTAYLSGIDDTTAHKIPKEIHVTCSADTEICQTCRLMRADGYNPEDGLRQEIDPRDPSCLSFIAVSAKQRRMAIKDYLGIPEPCPRAEFVLSEDLYTVRYVLLSDVESDSEVPIAATVITEGEELHCGEVCTIEGRVDQSPVTCEEVRVVTKHIPKDILSDYQVRDKALLEGFRTEDDTYDSLCKKIDDINFDLERNVTYIYNRPEVHTLFDLTFHSPLWIPFENSHEPGWVSCLLVSETAQGKSTIMRRLIKHYGYGAYIDAANTSVAGLVGGIKSVGRRQFVKWGILPQMDKRLVCIEEYANAPVELLRSMRATRDSGYVVMNKIDKGRAKARTRTIVMSNPKKLLKPGVVVDGVNLLEELVERPEDLRRFDVGMWIPKIEMDEWHDATDPKYTSEACHELITWTWTLPLEQIKFTRDAVSTIHNNTMKDNYPYLYLVGAREFDVKLSRLAAAVACRTYNVIDGMLVVEKRHVDWVCTFLRKLYDDPEFGYCNRVRREGNMDAAATVEQIFSALKQAGSPEMLCDFLSMYNRYVEGDLKAACRDSISYETVKNKLLILGCIVGEDDSKWNNTYLPTKRLKKHLEEVKKRLTAHYSIPKHIQEKQNEGSSTL